MDRQQNEKWTFEKWSNYFNLAPSERKKVYNVISVEFTNTKLESWVHVPDIIKDMDWVRLWPESYKNLTQLDNGKANYPKVQHYCLMGVAGSYTDFHIDFGGTSVWYHVIKGKKVFILIPPTEKNLELYEKWNINPRQSSIYFADLVNQKEIIKCEVAAGNTFLIPTGWIHAVYTPEDSVVFGGNFLQFYNSKLQIQIADIEKRCQVSPEFMFPYFEEMNWLAANTIVEQLLFKKRDTITDWERQSIVSIVDYISNHKEYFPLSLIHEKGEWWALYILDVLLSFLQSKEIPDKDAYLELHLYSTSPFPALQNCFCKEVKDDEVFVGCDYCGNWFHASCLGIDPLKARHLKFYYCNNCQRKIISANKKAEETPFHLISSQHENSEVLFDVPTKKIKTEEHIPLNDT